MPHLHVCLSRWLLFCCLTQAAVRTEQIVHCTRALAETAVGSKSIWCSSNQAVSLVWGCICLKLGARFSNLEASGLTSTAFQGLPQGLPIRPCAPALLFFWGTQCIYPWLGAVAMSSEVGKHMGVWSQAARVQILALPLASCLGDPEQII